MKTITKNQSNYLKLIGIITMAIDHIGMLLFPDLEILRIIGRIAFPLFAYQLVVGYINTQNLKKYIFRLLGLGILFQIPYTIAYAENNIYLNIFFTLAIGLICLWLIDNRRTGIVVGIMILTVLLEYYVSIIEFLKITTGPLFELGNYITVYEYGLYGLMMMITMYLFIENNRYLVYGILALSAVFIMFSNVSVLQSFSPLALFFICYPQNLKLKISSWFFYLFYPVHVVIIYLIKILWFS